MIRFVIHNERLRLGDIYLSGEILDIYRIAVSEKTTEHFSAQIDLSGQSKGMYLINLSIDKFKAVRKILAE
ncbi:MAG: hypothetical protein A2X05_12590 [Bacteroidetes bacterium GWE2_41_25]|nr:MAG: hypothetical protein A2X03_07355 [Bacteroidetes bacterium GWA2_40_15]OFX84505.1 MAG: hypothetical protein A2X06_11375 [Bacteroidetes bacterium GWC2_40_22]OFY04201.1 MAG: hypothetical protein A2X05_12590 [Bacteroidetes bacterium GWE2_41_25]OFY58465.1 MAG: hypothetical protein A2X04_05860 [Bacteroidetes bacterium GWF2_41_9]HAM10438.1 hypothetical protein [Bacteroidales bacterium]